MNEGGNLTETWDSLSMDPTHPFTTLNRDNPYTQPSVSTRETPTTEGTVPYHNAILPLQLLCVESASVHCMEGHLTRCC